MLRVREFLFLAQLNVREIRREMLHFICVRVNALWKRVKRLLNNLEFYDEIIKLFFYLYLNI